jgi:hypothetical protein
MGEEWAAHIFKGCNIIIEAGKNNTKRQTDTVEYRGQYFHFQKWKEQATIPSGSGCAFVSLEN